MIYVISPSSPLTTLRTSIFKRRKPGLNTEFSFSETGYPTKFKKTILSYYLCIAEIGTVEQIYLCLYQEYLLEVK